MLKRSLPHYGCVSLSVSLFGLELGFRMTLFDKRVSPDDTLSSEVVVVVTAKNETRLVFHAL
jgi:hypothetical protein